MYRRYPFTDMFDFFRDDDDHFRRLFNSMLGVPAAGPSRLLASGTDSPERFPALSGGRIHPSVESFVRGDDIVLRAEIPGIDPEQLEIEMAGSRLVIRGEKRREEKSDQNGVLLQEISYGRFERSFELPDGVTAEEIKASYVDGVLEVVLPAKHLPRSQKVPVQTKKSRWFKKDAA